jgi:phosphoesterase RecJ-like protein
VNNISKQTISEVNSLITNKDNIIITMHYNPDGDAIGSSLGLYHYLKKRNKIVTIISPNEYSDPYNWMPESSAIVHYSSEKDKAIQLINKSELIFFLDFNNLSRTENMEELLGTASAKKILIDHHPNPMPIADIVISDTSVSSTAELIFTLLSNIEDNLEIDKTIAECIYTGIMTDTGCFSYNSSQPYTFYIVSKLLEKNINKD